MILWWGWRFPLNHCFLTPEYLVTKWNEKQPFSVFPIIILPSNQDYDFLIMIRLTPAAGVCYIKWWSIEYEESYSAILNFSTQSLTTSIARMSHFTALHTPISSSRCKCRLAVYWNARVQLLLSLFEATHAEHSWRWIFVCESIPAPVQPGRTKRKSSLELLAFVSKITPVMDTRGNSERKLSIETQLQSKFSKLTRN